MSRLISQLLVVAVRVYQVVLSPHFGGACRFSPSCSEYAIEALRQHGPWRGVVLAVSRIGRCHPFHPGGIDPVPAAGGKRDGS
ncbi:MAG: membrane protein insertion efficiency factor YidD [bacterium]|nr:membrane protein insertion efficiency factor YidD [bacterium]MCP5070788.1 membrane protein insertion efficiency factor YidD [bacterium]